MIHMLSGDRLFTLVKLREISLGEEVELELSCSNTICRAKNIVTIHLDDLPVISYGSEREFAFTLPKSGQIVRFGYLDGHKEKRLGELQEPTLSAVMFIA